MDWKPHRMDTLHTTYGTSMVVVDVEVDVTLVVDVEHGHGRWINCA